MSNNRKSKTIRYREEGSQGSLISSLRTTKVFNTIDEIV